MASSYEQALTALYGAPHESFVAERQRLASELKMAGDKAGAAQLAKLLRPSISAWAVNQLWWQAREAFEGLFATAAQLRAGKHAASAAHRLALTKLIARAQLILNDAGHNANDATLRRVMMTLAGLAAAGGFEPDSPGQLSKDREPPGFEALGGQGSPESEGEPVAHDAEELGEAQQRKSKKASDAQQLAEAKRREVAEAKRAREALAAQRQREAEEEAKRRAERKKRESELREAKHELDEREREREHAAKQLAAAEREVERARAAVDAAQARLASESRVG
ncbi:MAG TPA: hypothetical protein VJV79_32555 [Polyangiaceae bacterium]|nr:hypothetical protein [Polyangiaceae bacterium]